MAIKATHELNEKIAQCLIKDQFYLKRQYTQLITDKKISTPQRENKLALLVKKIEKSIALCDKKRQLLPKIKYPDLPIVSKKEALLSAIEQHQVVIVAGETGSGKTTQLAKMCLEAGLGIQGMIAHTQPRRLAAKANALRIAEEMQTTIKNVVGFKVRFTDTTSTQCLVKLMTDGILLAETRSDKWLNQYDCIIVDEAHERSLNIDFLLGYLKQLLSKRKNLKVIITSATIDVEKFSTFFNGAPILEISGRSYPVSVHYLPAVQEDDDFANLNEAIEHAFAHGSGDILIFQSGEKEIKETAHYLSQKKLPNTSILPLFSRMAQSEQQKIFQASHNRKIIIATNVAETSLTVPNVRFVIDAGFARISRYNYRNKLQRLPIEPVSQASCEQRKGRCGRIGPGICYRLYSQEDFEMRPLYTEPEIVRTNLAGVILQLLSLGVRDIEHFPFIEAPDSRYIKDGYGLLERLGAIDESGRLTDIGKQMAILPIEPKLARMLIAAHHLGTLSELLIIVSALSIVDPRESPVEKREAAAQSHQQFSHSRSDFISYINLWNFIKQHRKHLSNQKFRLCCRQNYLSFIRVCEWQDVYSQLLQMTQEMNWSLNQVPSPEELIHQSILTGLLDSIGQWQEKKSYLGTRNLKFTLHPSSHLYKKPPSWVMACEIIHTNQNYARVNAVIDPLWLERLAKPLLKPKYNQPHYHIKSKRVVALQTLSLFGLEVIKNRKVDYQKIDHIGARKIFIQEALVEKNLSTHFRFFEKNCLTEQEIVAFENRLRRSPLFDETRLFEFYDQRLDEHICSDKALELFFNHFDQQKLVVGAKQVMLIEQEKNWGINYPEHYYIEGQSFDLTYLFDLSKEDDGVTLSLPLSALSKARQHDFSKQPACWLAEKIEALFRGLPKGVRLQLQPLDAHVQKALTFVHTQPHHLFDCLSLYLKKTLRHTVTFDTWASIRIPCYLNMHFNILHDNEVLAKGDSLKQLYESLSYQYYDALLPERHTEKRMFLWDFGTLDLTQQRTREGRTFTYYPALFRHANEVEIHLYESKKQAEYYHSWGVAQLCVNHLSSAIKQVSKGMTKSQRQCLTKNLRGYQSYDEFFKDLLLRSAFEVFIADQPRVMSQEVFERRLKDQSHFIRHVQKSVLLYNKIFDQYLDITKLLANIRVSKTIQPSLDDLKKQLKELFCDHFLQNVSFQWLQRYPVYLSALKVRLEKLPRQIQADQLSLREIQIIQHAYQKLLSAIHPNELIFYPEVIDFHFKIEELRVSLFAQSLGTLETISKARLLKAVAKLTSNL